MVKPRKFTQPPCLLQGPSGRRKESGATGSYSRSFSLGPLGAESIGISYGDWPLRRAGEARATEAGLQLGPRGQREAEVQQLQVRTPP